MTTFVVDWQQSKERETTDIWKKHFKLDSLNISTKDGSNFEMDARILMEIDDDSIIVKSFGSFTVFVDDLLSILVRNFFTYKDVAEVTLHRSEIQEEFSKLAQEKLLKYGVKMITFMIVNTSMLSSFKGKESKVVIKKCHIKEKGYGGNILLIFFGGVLLLAVSLGISTLTDKQSVNIDYKISIIYGIIVPILAIIIIYQHFEIEKLRRMLAKEE